MELNFKIGDKVIVARNEDSINLMGMTGSVIGLIESRNRVEVEFEDVPAEYRSELHTCNEKCKYGHGWTFSPRCLEPAVASTIDFAPAEADDICDISGEKADYKADGLKFKKDYAGLVKKCSQCGHYHYLKDTHRDGDSLFCKDCISENGWGICADCGDVIKGDGVTINPGLADERVICAGCATECFTCSDCGHTYSNNHLVYHGGGGYVCSECKDRWTFCLDCGVPVRIDPENCYNGSYYCSQHNPSRVNIHRYSYKPDPVFYGEGELFMGVELEIDQGNDPNFTASQIKRPQIYCKHDGSLGSDGIEIVTHPCTLDYHLSELGWDDVARIARDNGYTSHDAGTCGLHVHVNRDFFGSDTDEQELHISKIMMLFQKFWDEIYMFSRRRSGDLHWAGKPTVEYEKGETRSSMCGKCREEKWSGDRYRAVNLQNDNTVEFRIFRGTLSLNTLFATLQFVEGICFYAREHSIDDVFDCTWGELVGAPEFSYDELQNYLYGRGLA